MCQISTIQEAHSQQKQHSTAGQPASTNTAEARRPAAPVLLLLGLDAVRVVDGGRVLLLRARVGTEIRVRIDVA